MPRLRAFHCFLCGHCSCVQLELVAVGREARGACSEGWVPESPRSGLALCRPRSWRLLTWTLRVWQSRGLIRGRYVVALAVALVPKPATSCLHSPYQVGCTDQ
jgi:hypothetical protein